MNSSKKNLPAPPSISPYIFTILLAFFGVWCFYDGWLTRDPKMLEHALFNQVLSLVLLPWSIYDFYRLRRSCCKHTPVQPDDELNQDLKDRP